MTTRTALETHTRPSQGLRNVAVVGATGAVGAEMLLCLERSALEIGALKLFASNRSIGKAVSFQGGKVLIEELRPDQFDGVDIALFASETEVSRIYVPEATKRGAIAIDNSSAYRMDSAVPLVVPEVNSAAIAPDTRIIANPNCVAAIMAVALWPLHCAAGMVRITGATYQAASGAGAAAMEELELSTRAYLNGEDYPPKVLPHPYAFNLFSHNTAVDPTTGYNGEESKVIAEMRKITALPNLGIGVTCVRVPVLRAHAMALNVEFEHRLAVEEARRLIEAAPGLRLVDDRERNHFPMPVECSGRDEVLVGRIREDISDLTGRSLSLFIAGDQLLKGAALNAVQIAELVVSNTKGHA